MAPQRQPQQQQHAPEKHKVPEEGEQLLSEILNRDTERLEKVAGRYVKEISEAERLRKMMLTARAMEDLRSLLSGELMKSIMSLQNKKMGFLTDKTDNGYSEHVVREVVIQALLNGVYPFNNEINIIGGNMMIVQNGWRRKLHELKGMDAFPTTKFGDLTTAETYFRVPYVTTFKFEGKERRIEANVFVKRDKRTDAYATIDNILGKAERKILQTVYQQIAGSTFGDLDDDTGGAASSVTTPEDIAAKAEHVAAEQRARDEAARAEAERKEVAVAEYTVVAGSLKKVGVNHDDVMALYRELFPGRKWPTLTSDEVYKLVDAMKAKLKQVDPGEPEDSPPGEAADGEEGAPPDGKGDAYEG